jgi:hypothetical protein
VGLLVTHEPILWDLLGQGQVLQAGILAILEAVRLRRGSIRAKGRVRIGIGIEARYRKIVCRPHDPRSLRPEDG